MDFRHAVRNLMRRPLFTLVAVLTLAIGMGVNAVAFTVVNSVFFKGAAGADIPGAGRISPIPADESGGVSREELARYADATRGAVRVAAEGRLSMAWRHEGGTETVWALMVSGDYFPMLDPRPLAGRVHVAPGRGGAPAAVVGERFWRQRLQGAPLAGLTLRINNVDVSVSAVLPTSYRGPGGGGPPPRGGAPRGGGGGGPPPPPTPPPPPAGGGGAGGGARARGQRPGGRPHPANQYRRRARRGRAAHVVPGPGGRLRPRRLAATG